MYRKLTRRQVLQATALAAAATPAAPLTAAPAAPSSLVAGVDRVAVRTGRTFLRGQAPANTPVVWTKGAGPGKVTFADPKALHTTATFGRTGTYQLRLAAAGSAAGSTVQVRVVEPPPATQLQPVYPQSCRIDSPLWSARAKALIVNWIPHCIDQINRTDIEIGPGGIDNFVEAARKLRGEPGYGFHKGYVFSNAWVYQTIEAMCIALLVDAQGDREIEAAHAKMRATLDTWIPIILAAQEPDGYLQTAYTLPRKDGRGRIVDSTKFQHWDQRHRGDHEGYVAGYFLEAAINHFQMTSRKDARLYDAARKLADCWCRNIGSTPPRKPWYDGHQQMEQGLVRFGRFVNDVEGRPNGQPYIDLAKYLLDARYTTATSPREQQEYDQSHLPVTQQYEAVGHAVRAAYTYSGMADVAVETHDADYHSAVLSLWDNIVQRKYYVTGGIGSGETSEGFGPNYSLRNRAYNESCSTCGLIFFQWKLHLAYHDARYVDLYEESMYNALLGSTSLEGKHFYYDNPLDSRVARYRWHVCPCCVGNIPRTLLMFPTWMYSKSTDGIWVNLFAGSTVTIGNVSGTEVEMVQKTDYPWNGKVAITVNPRNPGTLFSIHIRVPNRASGTSELYRVSPRIDGSKVAFSINGTKLAPIRLDRGYATITRNWQAGDRVEFELPMQPQRVRGIDKIEATKGKVALRYGPLLYNLEQEDQAGLLTKSLAPDSALETEWRKDMLGGILVIKGKFRDGSPMLAIPNFARMNRHAGLAYPPSPPAPGPDGRRPDPPPPVSIVWIREDT